MAGKGARVAAVPLPGRGFDGLLVAYRQAAGLTQEELAEASGVSVRAIREMERGRVRVPQRRTVSILALALGLAGDEEVDFLAAAKYGRAGSRASASVTLDHVGIWPVPRELPAAAGDLVGRRAELSIVEAMTHQAVSSRRSTPAVVSIHGQAGVGKTALAVAAGHRFGAYFPDGQLFVDLDGIDDDGVHDNGEDPATQVRQSRDAGAVMAGLLRSLGVPDSQRPAVFSSQAGLYRTLTRDRRLLVVVDNVIDEAQVRPLIPSGGRCLMLVTSRRSLTGLESSVRIALDVLAADESVQLLDAIIGGDRLAAEPRAAPELARLCGQLPLALRIAGNRLASRPLWSIEQLVSLLDDEQRRLATLTAGDLGVEAAFEVSYRQLSPATAAMFRHFALIADSDFGVRRAATTAGVSEAVAAEAAEELVDMGLLLGAVDRYRFHDLVRLFARSRLERQENAADQPAA